MSTSEIGKPSRNYRSTILSLFIIVVIVLGGGMYFLAPRFERQTPQIKITPESDMLGLAPLVIAITDQGTGLKSVTATLTSGGAEREVASEQFTQPVTAKTITIDLTSKTAGVKEGPAVLRVVARDRSLWNYLRGNETLIQKSFTIDVTPPTLELIADDRYVNFGGVGMIVYKPSPDSVMTGVRVSKYFFPGYPGQLKDHPDHFVAFFAHPYDVSEDAPAVLVAADKAGNTKEMRIAYILKNVKYKKSKIALSDKFLQDKVVPLISDAAARQGSPKDIFLRVNKELRKVNEDRITAITKKSTPSILWKDAFVQLSNSKVEANFADARTYTYNDETIDNAFHLGYDLSVTKRYPVEAANSGTVAFVGDLGIYGNTVILDHGLGLFTLYSHLSSMDVKVGESLKQRQVVGKTGETGLAAGDHLHYGVYLHGVAILPVEWWDQKWIDDNIQPKLDGKSGKAIAESQPSKAVRKPARKRPR